MKKSACRLNSVRSELFASIEMQDETSKTNEFLQLLMTHQRQIYAFLRGMVPDRHDADDLFQDTILMMWSRFDQFEQGTSFTAWGITVAKYTVLAARKHHARRGRQFSEAVEVLLQQQSDQMLEQFDHRVDAVKHCVKKLNARDYELVRLRYDEETSVSKIAAQRDCSQQSIYKRMARIHASLIECIRRTLSREEFA